MSNRSTPALGLAALLAGCAPGGLLDLGGEPSLGDALAEIDQSACLLEKVSSNGICQNGLAASTLVEGGLTTMNVKNSKFGAWFEQDPALRDVFMRYLIKCAAPAGQTFTYKSTSGTQYSWTGDLDLAPDWAAGRTMTAAEMAVLTGCLGAHVNKFGVSVTIALEGRSATGEQIPVAADELASFPVREACFFGDLFGRANALYVGLDHTNWDAQTTSARACAIDGQQKGSMSEVCPPMVYVGHCREVCTPDATGTFYEWCSYGGATYRPITTRLRQSDVYRCGDGVCQFTESCSTCRQDCGSCP